MAKLKTPKLKIAIGSDHAGFQTKQMLAEFLEKSGFDVVDFGTHSEERADYPDYAKRVAKAVAAGKCDKGVLACGTGIGMSITANKVKGIRAAAPWSVATAKLASEHNWANVLCVPSRFVSGSGIKKIVMAWLKTPPETGGRHERRIKKIRDLELNR